MRTCLKKADFMLIFIIASSHNNNIDTKMMQNSYKLYKNYNQEELSERMLFLFCMVKMAVNYE